MFRVLMFLMPFTLSVNLFSAQVKVNYYDPNLVSKTNLEKVREELNDLAQDSGKVKLLKDMIRLRADIALAESSGRLEQRDDLEKKLYKLACSANVSPSNYEILDDRYRLFAEYWRAVAENNK